MQKKKLVVIGNGMAGMRTVEQILKRAPDLYDITVFGDEPYPNYNRIMLSPVLANEQTIDDIMIHTRAWYEEHNITLHTGAYVNKIDSVKQTVSTVNGLSASYDRLLIATGSKPFMPPIAGNDLEGVIGYRDINDTNAMIEASSKHQNAVIIGGGLLGLEAANGLKTRGMDVTVIHRNQWLLEKQLDQSAAALLQASLEAKGLTFHLETNTDEIVADANGRVTEIKFKEGFSLPADLVVFAVGIRPNYALAESAGLDCEHGILADDTLQTSNPNIYAVGECVTHRGINYGLVAPLYEMAEVCADHLVSQASDNAYEGSITSTKLKVTGIDLFSAGNFMGSPTSETITLQDPIGGAYKKLVIENDQVIGSCLYGDITDGAWYYQLIRENTDISEIRDYLMFGQESLNFQPKTGSEALTTLSTSSAQNRSIPIKVAGKQ